MRAYNRENHRHSLPLSVHWQLPKGYRLIFYVVPFVSLIYFDLSEYFRQSEFVFFQKSI